VRSSEIQVFLVDLPLQAHRVACGDIAIPIRLENTSKGPVDEEGLKRFAEIEQFGN
jgi:hypothetical protein